MTEAWLLFDEAAIRKAVGNPNGNAQLNIPPLRTIENVPDPKAVLFESLKIASGYYGRRLAKFEPQKYRHRVAELISAYDPLRVVDSFAKLEASIGAFIQELEQA